MGTIIIKNKTVGGDLCHQIFEIQEYKGEKILLICKKVITKNIDRYDSDFECLKVKNGYRLYMKNFSIRLSTLELVLNKLKNGNNKI